MQKSFKDLLILTGLTIVITFFIWLPFYLQLNNFLGLDFSNGINTIYRNFDGLEYIIIAKTFYDPALIAALPQSLPASYYAAHFPGFAVLILLISPFIGFLKSMIFISLLFTIASSISFYFLIKDFKLTAHPLLLSIIFLVLPARWLIVHSVGSAEPIFIFFCILSLYFFMKYEASQKFLFILLTGIAGMLAQFTRPPGILLFLAFVLYLTWKLYKSGWQNIIQRAIRMKIAYSPLALIPLALLGVFYWYSQIYGDFFAYFHSGDNIHLTFPPFQVFNNHQFWVGSIWLEDIIYIFLLGFLGAVTLFKQKLYPLAFFTFIYLAASTLVAHRDISRYVLPIFPFVLIAFEKTLVSKEFRIVLAILALGIYLYTQNFLIANTAPIPNLHFFN